MTTEPSPAGAPGAEAVGGRLSGVIVAGGRERAFRQARWHSLWVKTLRIALPLICVGVFGAYGLAVMRSAGWGEKLPQLPLPKVDPLNLTMENPHYEGYSKDGGRYVVSADTARQELSNLGVFKLDGIRARLTQTDATTTEFVAKMGVYDSKTALIELAERIKVTSSNGLVAHLTQATIESKEGRIASTQPVEVELPNANVRSRAMTLHHKTREIAFIDEVRARLTPAPKAPPKPLVDAAKDVSKDAASGAGGQAAAAVGAAAGAAPAGGLLSGTGGPIDIASNRLDIDDGRHTILFSGAVKAAQGDGTLQSPELLVVYEAGAGGAGKSIAATEAMTANRIDRMTAKGPVLLTRAARDQVTADGLEFDGRGELLTLAGNVVVTQGADRRVTAARADVDVRADTTLLTGGVVAAVGRNELRGRRLHLDNKAARMQLASPAEPGHGAERISAHFVREAPVAAAKKAPAASANPLSASFATDPAAPIDLQAATLDVDDRAKTAVFRGDVTAVQGDVSLRAAELTVRYAGQSGLMGAGGVAASGGAGAGATGATQITRIEARRKVLVTAKGGQTASGDRADFDTKANTVELGGDVVLTQGQNVVRGSKLVIDLNTGESRIVTSAAEGWQAKAGPDGAAPAIAAPRVPGAPLLKRDRPSAIFYPKDLKKQSPGGAGATAPASSAWDAQAKPVRRSAPVTPPAPGFPE